MNLEYAYRASLEELGYDLDEIYQLDNQNMCHHVKNCLNSAQKSTLTFNKNLADVAESLIDSLATLELPAWGYGLRYKYGNLKQASQRRMIKNSPSMSSMAGSMHS
jgi:glycogen phosphorylase